MSITQEQFDALKPGDRVQVWYRNGAVGSFVGTLDGQAFIVFSGNSKPAYGHTRAEINAVILPTPSPVAWINVYADGFCGPPRCSRREADDLVSIKRTRTHVITIYSDGSTTTEAVS